MTFDNVPKFCRTLLVPCSRLPNSCALSIFSFTWQIPSSFFKIVLPYKCSIRFYNTRLTQTLNFNDCFGRLHNGFCCSCFEVSNTLNHLSRGGFNRAGGIFLLQVWGIIASAPEHPLCLTRLWFITLKFFSLSVLQKWKKNMFILTINNLFICISFLTIFATNISDLWKIEHACLVEIPETLMHDKW